MAEQKATAPTDNVTQLAFRDGAVTIENLEQENATLKETIQTLTIDLDRTGHELKVSQCGHNIILERYRLLKAKTILTNAEIVRANAAARQVEALIGQYTAVGTQLFDIQERQLRRSRRLLRARPY